MKKKSVLTSEERIAKSFMNQMNKLYRFMDRINKKGNYELICHYSIERFTLYKLDENNNRTEIEWYATPVGFYTEE